MALANDTVNAKDRFNTLLEYLVAEKEADVDPTPHQVDYLLLLHGWLQHAQHAAPLYSQPAHPAWPTHVPDMSACVMVSCWLSELCQPRNVGGEHLSLLEKYVNVPTTQKESRLLPHADRGLSFYAAVVEAVRQQGVEQQYLSSSALTQEEVKQRLLNAVRVLPASVRKECAWVSLRHTPSDSLTRDATWLKLIDSSYAASDRTDELILFVFPKAFPQYRLVIHKNGFRPLHIPSSPSSPPAAAAVDQLELHVWYDAPLYHVLSASDDMAAAAAVATDIAAVNGAGSEDDGSQRLVDAATAAMSKLTVEPYTTSAQDPPHILKLSDEVNRQGYTRVGACEFYVRLLLQTREMISPTETRYIAMNAACVLHQSQSQIQAVHPGPGDSDPSLVRSAEQPSPQRWSSANCQTIGEVQGGKTNSMICVIAKAVDRSVRVVVVFSGNTDTLRAQAQSRMERYFPRHESSRFVWCTAPNKDVTRGTGGLQWLEENKLMQYLRRRERQPEPMKQWVLMMVIKKCVPSLRFVHKQLLSQLDGQESILYVDDESDHASVVTTDKRMPNGCTRAGPGCSGCEVCLGTTPFLYSELLALVPKGSKEAQRRWRVQQAAAEAKQEQLAAEEEGGRAGQPRRGSDIGGSNSSSSSSLSLSSDEDEDEEDADPLSSPAAAYAPLSEARDVRHRITFVRYTATPTANLSETRRSRLVPHSLWLLDRYHGSHAYMGGEEFFIDVPLDRLFPELPGSLDHRASTFNWRLFQSVASSPLQPIPYCDFPNYAPRTVLDSSKCPGLSLDPTDQQRDPLFLLSPIVPGPANDILPAQCRETWAFSDRLVWFQEHFFMKTSARPTADKLRPALRRAQPAPANRPLGDDEDDNKVMDEQPENGASADVVDDTGVSSSAPTPRHPPFSIIQALVDFLLTGAIRRWRTAVDNPRHVIMHGDSATVRAAFSHLSGFRLRDQMMTSLVQAMSGGSSAGAGLGASTDSRGSSAMVQHTDLRQCLVHRDAAFQHINPLMHALAEHAETVLRSLGQVDSGLAHDRHSAYRAMGQPATTASAGRWLTAGDAMQLEAAGQMAHKAGVCLRVLVLCSDDEKVQPVDYASLLSRLAHPDEFVHSLELRLKCTLGDGQPVIRYILLTVDTDSGAERYWMPRNVAFHQSITDAGVPRQLTPSKHAGVTAAREMKHAAIFHLTMNQDPQEAAAALIDEMWEKVCLVLPHFLRQQRVQPSDSSLQFASTDTHHIQARVGVFFPVSTNALKDFKDKVEMDEKMLEALEEKQQRRDGGVKMRGREPAKPYHERRDDVVGRRNNHCRLHDDLEAELGKWHSNLHKWRDEYKQGVGGSDPDSWPKEWADILYAFNKQWDRLQGRNEELVKLKRQPDDRKHLLYAMCPVNQFPSLTALVPWLDQVVSTTAIRIANRKKLPVLVDRQLKEFDYEELSEPRASKGSYLAAQRKVPVNVILVGGNILSRGLTVEGLTVSYYTRGAATDQADSSLQMARWYGYRGHGGRDKDLCTVYVQKRACMLLMGITAQDRAMRATARAFISEGRDISREPFVLMENCEFTSHCYRLTSGPKGYNLVAVRRRPMEFLAPSTGPSHSQEVQANMRAVDDLRRALSAAQRQGQQSNAPSGSIAAEAGLGVQLFVRCDQQAVVCFLRSLHSSSTSANSATHLADGLEKGLYDVSPYEEQLHHAALEPQSRSTSVQRKPPQINVAFVEHHDLPSAPVAPLPRRVLPAEELLVCTLYDAHRARNDRRIEGSGPYVIAENCRPWFDFPNMPAPEPSLHDADREEERKGDEEEAKGEGGDDQQLQAVDYSLLKDLTVRQGGAPILIVVHLNHLDPSLAASDRIAAAAAEAGVFYPTLSLALPRTTVQEFIHREALKHGGGFEEIPAGNKRARARRSTPRSDYFTTTRQQADEFVKQAREHWRDHLPARELRPLRGEREDNSDDDSSAADSDAAEPALNQRLIPKAVRTLRIDRDDAITTELRLALLDVIRELMLEPLLYFRLRPEKDDGDGQDEGEYSGVYNHFVEPILPDSYVDRERLLPYEEDITDDWWDMIADNRSYSVSLLMIEHWLVNEQYSCLSQVESDVLVMWRNSLTFNGAKETVGQMAKRLKKRFVKLLQHKAEFRAYRARSKSRGNELRAVGIVPAALIAEVDENEEFESKYEEKEPESPSAAREKPRGRKRARVAQLVDEANGSAVNSASHGEEKEDAGVAMSDMPGL